MRAVNTEVLLREFGHMPGLEVLRQKSEKFVMRFSAIATGSFLFGTAFLT